MEDQQILDRYRVVEFIQCNLRLFAGLYVSWRYLEVLRERGVADSRDLFGCREFSDVRGLIEQVTLT
jgi:hypothetical protein